MLFLHKIVSMTTPPGASYRSRIIVSQKIIPVLGLSLPLFVFWIFANYSDTALPLDDLTLLADRLNRRSDFHGKPSFPLFGQKCPNNILANPSCFCKNYFYFFLPKPAGTQAAKEPCASALAQKRAAQSRPVSSALSDCLPSARLYLSLQMILPLDRS